MKKSEIEESTIIWRGVGLVVVVAQAIISFMLVISMINTGIVASWITILVAIVLTALLTFNVVKLLVQNKTSTVTRIVCMVLGIICIIGGVFAMRYTGAFNEFLNRVTEQKAEVKEYSVIVMNDSGIKDLSGLAGKSVGLLETDKEAKKAGQHLQGLVKVDTGFYDSMDTLISMLEGKLIDAMTIESDRMEIAKEEMDSGLESMQVIYTFEIELDGKETQASNKKVTTEPFIVYISGSDSRTGIKTTARSDVNIVAVVDPAKGKMLLVSIPRDTYVQLHDTTGIKDKLTHAGVYGIEMSKATIEDFLGIKIDHTIKVSFDTVVKVVDQLDGIEINSDQALQLKTNGKVCNYVVGKQVVDGDCALRFARERKSYETGDRHRGENQQEVITGIVKKLSGSKDYLLKVPEILEIAADSFETTFQRDDIAGFIRMQLENSKNWQVESIAVNGTGTMLPTYSMGANLPLYVMIPDENTVANARTKINQYLNVSTVDDAEE